MIKPKKSRYAPAAGSTAWKVIEFLTTNPDEYLSAADIEAKFSHPALQVHSALAQAIDAGALTREEELESGDLMYRLGVGCAAVQAAPARATSLLAGAWQAPVKRRGKAPFIDVDALVIRHDVPMPSKHQGHYVNWKSLFERMPVGSSVELPLKVSSSASKMVHDYSKKTGARFSVRKLNDETIGLWRDA